MMFANTSPPEGIVGWLACLSFVMGIVYLGMRIRRETQTKPSAQDVQNDAAGKYQPKGDYATRGDLTQLESRINAMSTASDVSRHELRMHIDQSVSKLGDRMEALREDIGEVERRLNQTSEQRAVESHKRHNELLAAVSELRGAFDQVNR